MDNSLNMQLFKKNLNNNNNINNMNGNNMNKVVVEDSMIEEMNNFQNILDKVIK